MGSNRYKYSEVLGEGGHSVIYRAHDTLLQRPVALKCAKKELIASKPEYTAVFAREAQRLASLEHPNILPIYDFGLVDQIPFIVCHLATGKDLLSRVVPKTKIDLGDVGAIAKQASAAVDFCRSRGVAHRDVKLENLLIGESLHVYLADFGLACEYNSPEYMKGAGDVCYVAPEQLPGSPLCGSGELCDQFSLGVCLYVLLTGHLPLREPQPGKYSSVDESMRKCTAFRLMCREQIEPVSALGQVPRSVDDVLGRMLAVDPSDRFPSCSEAADVLYGALTGANKDKPYGEVFVSYSRADAEIIERLVGRIKECGLSVWWDRMMPKGVNWDDEIEFAMERADAMLVVLTSNSAGSQRVRDEWGYWIDTKKPLVTLKLTECKIPFRLHRNNYVDAQQRPIKQVADELAIALTRVLAESRDVITSGERPMSPPNHSLTPTTLARPERAASIRYLLSPVFLEPSKMLKDLGVVANYIPRSYIPKVSAMLLNRYLAGA